MALKELQDEERRLAEEQLRRVNETNATLERWTAAIAKVAEGARLVGEAAKEACGRLQKGR